MLLEKERKRKNSAFRFLFHLLIVQSFPTLYCLLSPGIHGFPGSGIMSLFITKCLVTSVSGEENVEKSHIWIQTQWGDLSAHPSSFFAAVKFRFYCWFFFRFMIPCETPSGRANMSPRLYLLSAKKKNPCKSTRISQESFSSGSE